MDGYNIIGAWPELQKLKKIDLSAARDLLIEKMAEYQAYSGQKVIIVFDAQFVDGPEKKEIGHQVEVIFTKKNETADERIERLAISLQSRTTKIYVATSDYTEQWTIFSEGALRISARELLTEVEAIEKQIEREIKQAQEQKLSSKIRLSKEITEIFEKWRRGE